MQTPFRKPFFALITSALLLSSGALMAHDKPAHPQSQHHKPHHSDGKAYRGHAHHSPRFHKHAQREHRLDKMRMALQLTPNQFMELRVLFNDHHAERKALRHAHAKRFHAVLTPQQRHRWREWREERHAHREH
ncbi:MAG: hypothetical protein IE913_07400 [Halothiobacillus sp.]|nr:hypothetical protein [Rhodobacterales bacterium]MBD3816263.1 hypothetical protein [Halothiobacillus sp.]